MRLTVLTLLAAVVFQAGAAGQGTKLAGVWKIDKTKGTASAATFDLVLTVKVDADSVWTTSNLVSTIADVHNFVVDGRAHSFPWGDTIPPGTREATVSWLRDADGFAGTEGGARIRWTVSPDGQSLTVETTWSNGRHDIYLYNRRNN